MKRIAACLAIFIMISAMVSCERADKKDDRTSEKTTSSSSATVSENTSKEPETTTVANSKAENIGSTNADATNNTAVSASYDISSIVGTWYEENALDSRTLTVNADRTYQLAYRGGGSEFGTVKTETQEMGDGDYTNVWYCFFPDEGNEWARFRITQGEDMHTKLCSGFDDTAMIFVSAADISQAAQDSNSDPAPAEKFAGAWDCGRCHIVISRIGYGTYSADIHWSSSASEGCNWTYFCKYHADNDELVSDGMGICTEYANLGESSESSVQKYTDGSAVFNILDNGNLTWHDYNANVADGLEFTRG